MCSIHFEKDCFEKPLIQKMLNYSPRQVRKLKKNAIPTIRNSGKHSTPEKVVFGLQI